MSNLSEIIQQYRQSLLGFFTWLIGTGLTKFLERMEGIPALLAPLVSICTLSVLILTVVKMVDQYLMKEFNRSLLVVLKKSVAGILNIFKKNEPDQQNN